MMNRYSYSHVLPSQPKGGKGLKMSSILFARQQENTIYLTKLRKSAQKQFLIKKRLVTTTITTPEQQQNLNSKSLPSLIEVKYEINNDKITNPDPDNDTSLSDEVTTLNNLITEFFKASLIKEKYEKIKNIRQIITRDEESLNTNINLLRSIQHLIDYRLPGQQQHNHNQIFIRTLIDNLKMNSLNHNYKPPIEYLMIEEALWILSTLTERRDHIEILLKFDILEMLTHYIFVTEEETSGQSLRIINNILNSSFNHKISDCILAHLNSNKYFEQLNSKCEEYKNSVSIELLVTMFVNLFNHHNYSVEIEQEKNDETDIEFEDQKNENNNDQDQMQEDKKIKIGIYLNKMVPFLLTVLLKYGRNPTNDMIAKFILEFFKNITSITDDTSEVYKDFLIKHNFMSYIIDIYLRSKLSIATEVVYIIKNLMSTEDSELIDHVIDNQGLIVMSSLLNKYKHNPGLNSNIITPTTAENKLILLSSSLPSTRNHTFETLLVSTLKYAPLQLHQADKVFKCSFNLVQNMINLMCNKSLSSTHAKKDVVYFIDLIVSHKNKNWDGNLIRNGVLIGLIDLLDLKQHWDPHILFQIFSCLRTLLNRFIGAENNQWYTAFIERQGWEIIEKYQNHKNDKIDYYIEEILQKTRMKIECTSDSDNESDDNDNDDNKFYEDDNNNNISSNIFYATQNNNNNSSNSSSTSPLPFSSTYRYNF
jgi:hypothetical protein